MPSDTSDRWLAQPLPDDGLGGARPPATGVAPDEWEPDPESVARRILLDQLAGRARSRHRPSFHGQSASVTSRTTSTSPA